MKEFKYTIDGKEYKVQIDAVEGNIASVNVNGEAYKVEMEQEAEPEKKKVVLGQPAASDDAEATPAANVNTANAVKAPLPGTITSIEVGKYVASLPLAFKIARYFGLSIEDVFVYEEE